MNNYLTESRLVAGLALGRWSDQPGLGDATPLVSLANDAVVDTPMAEPARMDSERLD